MSNVDISDVGTRALIAKRILQDIDAFAIKSWDDGFRWHLGASIIGEPCKRSLWYKYRWVRREVRTGREFRLLNRGNLEEVRYENYLLGIGAQVWSKDENGKQFKVSWLHGHFGGSTDGVIKLPEAYGITEAVLAEYKTKGTGRGFNELMVKGVAKTNMVHFAQACTYGYGMNLNYSAYFSTCKNDDDMHIELVKLDHNMAQQMINKAEEIILSPVPPARISDNPLYDECKINCKFTDICHAGKPVEKNCRSCKHCIPTTDASFFCNVENAVIPREIVYQGCGAHESINVVEKVIQIVKPSVGAFEIENVPLPT